MFSMVTSRGLNHININVRDVQRSVRFYRDAFGLEVKFWHGEDMAFLGTPGGQDVVTLYQAKPGEPIGNGGITHFGFGLQDAHGLDESVAQVERAGGKLISRGEHAPGVLFAFFEDPDGYVIEIGNT
jgi:catechol 2,3-dioxygenase-like lactoylglutathione lyase family enzyme